MSTTEDRQIARDSLFLLAEVELAGEGRMHRVKVRNLSPGGMMAEGDITVVRGARVTVVLRNVGRIEGSVAWVQDNRFGIAFVAPIDPRSVRTPVGAPGLDKDAPRFVRTPLRTTPDPGLMRKI